MMTLFSIPVAEKSGVSVACFKIIKPFFFLIWLLLRFPLLVSTVTYQIIIYLGDISISCIYPIGVYKLLESMAGLFSLGKFLAVISSNFALVSSSSFGILIINWDFNSMHIRPFPSAPQPGKDLRDAAALSEEGL